MHIRKKLGMKREEKLPVVLGGDVRGDKRLRTHLYGYGSNSNSRMDL